MEPFDEAAWREQLLRARAETLRNFRDPLRSPYAAVARHEFAGGAPLVFGSASDCDAPLEGLAAHELRARVDGDSFELESIDPAARFCVVGPSGPGPEQTRARLPAGARVQLGRYLLRLSHQNFPAALVLDAQSPRLVEGPPPIWFEPDAAFRAEGQLVRDAAPREEIVLSTRGQRRRALRLGQLSFQLGGAPFQLSALRLLEPGSDEAGFSIFFRDQTSGHESYPVGRYLEPRPLDGPGGSAWLLDFNSCYNPSCAFSPLFNCPIPPRENLLPAAVRAGERDPHSASGAHG